jgi:hypothetical protein
MEIKHRRFQIISYFADKFIYYRSLSVGYISPANPINVNGNERSIF